MKWRSAWRVQFLFFVRFLLVLAELSFWEGGWGLGDDSIGFWDFSDVTLLFRILSLKSFGNL